MRYAIVRHLSQAAGLAVIALATTAAIAAEREPRARPAVQPQGIARVIVSYKPAAGVLRAHALQANATRETVVAVLQQRANVLGQRAGVGLTVGRAISARALSVTAAGISSEALAQRLAADPEVEYAVVNRRQRALLVPNDPLYASGPAVNLAAQTGGPEVGQWYLRAPTSLFKSAINAQAAWDRTMGSPSVVVAVLDTGVRYDHVDLQGQLLAGYDMIDEDSPGVFDTANDGNGRDADANDPGDWITPAEDASTTGPFSGCGKEDSSWHGTHVASIISAATNNGLGMAGVAPGARVLPVRVLGKCGGYDSDIQAGMLWAVGIAVPGVPANPTPARVLNMSLGSSAACSAAYSSTVAKVNATGAVVVAAAGNSNGHAVGTPASCPGVIAVTGLRHAGSKVGFSDLGPEITIAAPGGNCINVGEHEPCLYPILAASNLGTTVPLSGGSIYTGSFADTSVGTSFSAPIVAGTAALMLSLRPALTPLELKAALNASAQAFPTSGADNGTDPTPVTQCVPPNGADQLQCYCTTALCGAGILDADRATLAAAYGFLARIATSVAAPVDGGDATLTSAPSFVAGGIAVTRNWSVVSGATTGSIVGSDADTTVLLRPSAGGEVTVRLTLTDGAGSTSVATYALAMKPGPSSGGGAMSAAWLALLALAAAGLHRRSTV